MTTALAGALHHLQLRDGGVAQALHLAQTRFRSGNHFGEGAEFGEQRLGQKLHVAAGQRAEQQELQEFVVAERIGAGFAEPRAQTLAMAVVMRVGFGEAGRILREVIA
jgi:hypothetical protein